MGRVGTFLSDSNSTFCSTGFGACFSPDDCWDSNLITASNFDGTVTNSNFAAATYSTISTAVDSADTTTTSATIGQHRISACWWLTFIEIGIGLFLIIISEIYGDPGDGFFLWDFLKQIFMTLTPRTTTTTNTGNYGDMEQSPSLNQKNDNHNEDGNNNNDNSTSKDNISKNDGNNNNNNIKQEGKKISPGDRRRQRQEQRRQQRRYKRQSTITGGSSSPFTNTIRTESNFLKHHQDETLVLPSEYGPEYNPTSIYPSILPLRGLVRPTKGGGENNNNDKNQFALSFVASKSSLTVFLGSAGVAFVCSAGSTVLWLILNYEETCIVGSENDPEDGVMYVWVTETSRTFVALIQGYVFFPVFLLVGYISFIAHRWRDWMVNCHAMQGNIHDIGVVCGGSFTKPPTLEQRKLLFKIYRHLNAIHALCYKSVSESLCHLELDDFCYQLGLLTPEELSDLYPYPSKVRDAIITKVTSEIAMLCESGSNMIAPHGEIIHMITQLRGRAARHHDMFIRDNPNLYLNLMFWVVNTLIFFIILFYPFTLLLYTPSSFPLLACFQPATLFGVFLVLFSYKSAFSMICRLRNPFSWTRDRIKVDMLLASTDMCLFTVLRNSFTAEEGEGKGIASFPTTTTNNDSNDDHDHDSDDNDDYEDEKGDNLRPLSATSSPLFSTTGNRNSIEANDDDDNHDDYIIDDISTGVSSRSKPRISTTRSSGGGIDGRHNKRSSGAGLRKSNNLRNVEGSRRHLNMIQQASRRPNGEFLLDPNNCRDL